MAELGTNMHTLPDLVKTVDSMGRERPIIDLLSQDQGILQVMPFVQADMPLGHVTSVVTGYPEAVWGQLNKGVMPTKGDFAQITETMGHIESWLEVPKKLLDMKAASGMSEKQQMDRLRGYIAAQSMIHQRSLQNKAATALLYANNYQDTDQFLGLTPRYSSKTSGLRGNILSGDAAPQGSKYSSIWFVGFGEGGVYGIYPPNTYAGLKHSKEGLVTSETAGGTGTRMKVWREDFLWYLGLAVDDWRCCVRIAEIDTAKLIAKATDAAPLQDLTIRAESRIPKGKGHLRWCYLMNRTMIQEFTINRRDDVKGAGMTYVDVDGKRFTSLRGYPILSTDALLSTEVPVAA